MNKTSISVIMLLVILGCKNENSKQLTLKDSSINVEEVKQSRKLVKHDPKNSKIYDFLKISEDAKESFMGYMGGVEKSDSSGPYVTKEFVSDTLSFELFFFPRKLNKNSVDFTAVKKAKSDNYRDFVCFAFVYPMKNSQNMNDSKYHDDNITYPVVIKSYARRGQLWEFVSTFLANDLSELRRYEIKTMYSVMGH